MTSPTLTPPAVAPGPTLTPPAVAPGFLEDVDATVLSIDVAFSAYLAAYAYGMALAQASQAQRTTPASARATRSAAHREQLPMAGGAR